MKYYVNVATFFFIMALMVIGSVNVVFGADSEVQISENGDSSQSQVTINNESAQQVNQSNNASITNTITLSVSSGNNNASANTGDTSISTGSTSVDTSVINTEINSNYAQAGSASIDAQGSIIGNGADSQNSITQDNSNVTSVIQSNNASITNVISTFANTGNNIANNNTGDVTIETGDIYASTNVTNNKINISRFTGGAGGIQSHNLMIKNNGEGSTNTINISDNSNTNLFVSHSASIYNDIRGLFITGNNSANRNVGNVWISTGDIFATTVVTNEKINTSTIEIKPICEETQHPEDPPVGGQPPSNPPTTTTTSNPSNPETRDGGRGGEGSVLAAVTGGGLPVTGGYMLFLMTLVALLLFTSGLYLRNRSGCSPGYAFAY